MSDKPFGTGGDVNRFRLTRPVSPVATGDMGSGQASSRPEAESGSAQALSARVMHLEIELAQATAALAAATAAHAEEVARLESFAAHQAKQSAEEMESRAQARFEAMQETMQAELQAQALTWARQQVRSEWEAQWRDEAQQQVDAAMSARAAELEQAWATERQTRLTQALAAQQEALSLQFEQKLSEATARWEAQSLAFQSALQSLQERWQHELTSSAIGLAHAALRHVLSHQLTASELAAFASKDLLCELAGERLLRIRVGEEDFELLQARWPSHWIAICEAVPGWPRGHCEIQTPQGHWHASLADRITQLESLWGASIGTESTLVGSAD